MLWDRNKQENVHLDTIAQKVQLNQFLATLELTNPRTQALHVLHVKKDIIAMKRRLMLRLLKNVQLDIFAKKDLQLLLQLME